jgi:type IV pilus assembly protein PilA
MKCPYCGEMIADATIFCPKCGNKVATSSMSSAGPAGTVPVGVPGYVASTAAPSGAAPVAVGIPGSTYAPVGPAETSGKAIASLIMAILIFIPFSAVAAIVLGHLSLSEIRKSAGRLTGEGLAKAGLILGYAEIALIPLVLIIAAIAIPNLLRAKMAANEAASVASLRAYSSAIMSYAEKCPDKGYPASTINLGPGSGDCGHANLLDMQLGSGRPIKSGYYFEYHPGPPDETGHVTSYTILADPVGPGTTGIKHFFVDESLVIRGQANRRAGPASPALE